MRIKRKTFLLWRKIFLYTGIFLCVFGVFYIFFKTSLFTITSYELIGVPDEKKAQILAGIENIASVPRYKVLPTNRIFTYQGTKIKTLIKAILPDTESVSTSVRSLHTVRITVTNYTPIFTVDGTHAINQEGVIYQEQNINTSLPKLVVASSSQETTTTEGLEIVRVNNLPNNFLVNAAKLVSQINPTIFTVSKVELDNYGDVLLTNTASTSVIKYSSKEDPVKVWSNLVSAIDTEPLKSKLVDSKDKLEYLDARFGNKVFFKFTNEGKTTIMPTYEATSTATTTLR